VSKYAFYSRCREVIRGWSVILWIITAFTLLLS
jgi:hypothetical protein